MDKDNLEKITPFIAFDLGKVFWWVNEILNKLS